MLNLHVVAHQRKQVTGFKFSDNKFSSDIWRTLKSYMSAQESSAAGQTHYVCQYCRPILNKNNMPCRCVLHGLETEHVPSELLDPLSKQLIQRSKAFQAVYRLGTYTGNTLSYNSLKACKGTMFFLPLPLDKTVQTLEEMAHQINCQTLSCLLLSIQNLREKNNLAEPDQCGPSAGCSRKTEADKLALCKCGCE